MLISYPFRFILANARRMFNRASRPFLLNYSTTFRCNMACAFCENKKQVRSVCEDEEVTTKDISLFLRDPMLSRLDVIVLSGGEPFMKKDLADIIMSFQNHCSPYVFHITTNGYMTETIVPVIEYLYRKKCRIHLKVSIDGTEKIHDDLRKTPGSYKRAVETVSQLRRKYMGKDLYIGINQTICETNYAYMDEVERLAVEMDCDYRAFVALKSWPLLGGSCENITYELVDLSVNARQYIEDRFVNYYLKIWSMKAFNNVFERMVHTNYINGQLRLLRGLINKHRCMNLFTHFRLNPNGDVLTCSYDIESIGNIKTASYTDIINGALAQEKRLMVKRCGKCWLGCEVSPNWFSSLFIS